MDIRRHLLNSGTLQQIPHKRRDRVLEEVEAGNPVEAYCEEENEGSELNTEPDANLEDSALQGDNIDSANMIMAPIPKIISRIGSKPPATSVALLIKLLTPHCSTFQGAPYRDPSTIPTLGLPCGSSLTEVNRTCRLRLAG